jgi:hypothetical protein
MLPINFIAVTGAAVAAFILGFLFHGPLLERLWMKSADLFRSCMLGLGQDVTAASLKQKSVCLAW